MKENENIVVESALNKNTLLYGNIDELEYKKNLGPSCVDMRGEKIDIVVMKRVVLCQDLVQIKMRGSAS